MFKRSHLELLKSRVNESRKFIQVLKGPRQVGKTTLIRQLVDEISIPYIYASADDISNAGAIWIEKQWESARVKLNDSGAESLLLIFDEIQKVSGWSEIVKALWDQDSFRNVQIKLVILGSAGLMIQKGLTESLAGRFEVIQVYHWSLEEMETAFGFTPEEYVWFGGYPGSAVLVKDEQRYKDYIRNSMIETTISKDILMMTRVDKPTLLKKVFELGTLYSSRVLSFNKMLGQLQDAGNTTTLSHYLSLLNNAGLLCGIEKYYVEQHEKKSSSPKFQVRNTAFIAALSDKTINEAISESDFWGRVVESSVGAHLVNFSNQGGYNVYYWRHVNDEVDFVLEKGGKLIGLEIKTSPSKPTAGMAAFKKKFNPYKVMLIGTSGLHWKEFLKINPAELF